MDQSSNNPDAVLTCGELHDGDLGALLGRFGLQVQWCDEGDSIPGTYWGEPEAGRIGSRLYVRPDTPVHSALHEACHFICMDTERRARETIDAGGTVLEECAVCYLQIRLAAGLRGMGEARMLADMDRWGYSFRLGSARAWFEADAEDAREFLELRGILDAPARPVAAGD
jgi:hypothetical protein